MAYILIANLYQSKYASLANGLESQYSMKNKQYHKDLILTADIMKNRLHNDSGMIKNRAQDTKTRNFQEKNKIGEKEEKATEEESQASFTQKIKLRKGTWYLCGKPGHTFPYCTKASYTPKDKWALRILESTVSLFPIELNQPVQEYYFPPNTKPKLR